MFFETQNRQELKLINKIKLTFNPSLTYVFSLSSR